MLYYELRLARSAQRQWALSYWVQSHLWCEDCCSNWKHLLPFLQLSHIRWHCLLSCSQESSVRLKSFTASINLNLEFSPFLLNRHSVSPNFMLLYAYYQGCFHRNPLHPLSLYPLQSTQTSVDAGNATRSTTSHHHFFHLARKNVEPWMDWGWYLSFGWLALSASPNWSYGPSARIFLRPTGHST